MAPVVVDGVGELVPWREHSTRDLVAMVAAILEHGTWIWLAVELVVVWPSSGMGQALVGAWAVGHVVWELGQVLELRLQLVLPRRLLRMR